MHSSFLIPAIVTEADAYARVAQPVLVGLILCLVRF